MNLLKYKLIGFALIIIGAMPFLTKIKAIADIKALSYLVPGSTIYQIILIVLGVLLIWTMQPRIQARRY